MNEKKAPKQRNISLRGILDKALAGNFVCIRGYAPMVDLHTIKEQIEIYYKLVATESN